MLNNVEALVDKQTIKENVEKEVVSCIIVYNDGSCDVVNHDDQNAFLKAYEKIHNKNNGIINMTKWKEHTASLENNECWISNKSNKLLADFEKEFFTNKVISQTTKQRSLVLLYIHYRFVLDEDHHIPMISLYNEANNIVAAYCNIKGSTVRDKTQRDLGLSSEGFCKILTEYLTNESEELHRVLIDRIAISNHRTVKDNYAVMSKVLKKIKSN